MKRVVKSVLILVITACLDGSAQDFSAYDRVTDQGFRDFLGLFPRRDLPFKTDRLAENMPFHPVENLSKENVKKYLMDNEGSYFFSKIFTYEADGIVQDIYGGFEPAFCFPTSGDFVILAIFQSHGTGDYLYKTLLMSFDLKGNFISLIGPGFLDSGYENYAEIILNADLTISHTFVGEFKEFGEFLRCKPCQSNYYTKSWRINNVGTSVEVGTIEHGVENFRYGGTGYFFHKVD